MNKRLNLFVLGMITGLSIGFSQDVVKVLTLVGMVAFLFICWDDYEVEKRLIALDEKGSKVKKRC